VQANGIEIGIPNRSAEPLEDLLADCYRRHAPGRKCSQPSSLGDTPTHV
jgi:hypothetical protein